MQWASLILALVKGLAQITAWLRERELIHAGEQKQIAAALARQAEDLLAAEAAREDRRRVNAAHPDGVPDDGFRRD